MTSQELKRGSEVLQKYQYGFGELDSQNQLRNNGKLESVSSWIGTAQQWTQKFTYDSVGRLREAKETKGDTTTVSYKQVFDYDRFGNLFRKSTSNPTNGQENPLPYTAIETGDIDPAKNRFTTASGTAYNDNGQVVTDGKFRNLGYGYDANGRMVRASQANQPDAVSVYDALGNRVAEKVNDVWQFVIYDAFGKIVAEYGGNPQPDEGGVKYYLQDWQGSVRAGVNAGGFVKSRADHQAFGEDIASGVGLRTTAQGFGAPQANRQGYGLTEKDAATGLNHTWFRKNENRAGRWTSPDPYNGSASVGNPQSWNRYSYVQGDPTNFVDPSGLFRASDSTKYGSDLRGTGFMTAGQSVLHHAWDSQPSFEITYAPIFDESGNLTGFSTWFVLVATTLINEITLIIASGAESGSTVPIDPDSFVETPGSRKIPDEQNPEYEPNPFDTCESLAEKIRDMSASVGIRHYEFDPSSGSYLDHAFFWTKQKNILNRLLQKYKDGNCKTLSEPELEKAVENAKAKAPPAENYEQFRNRNGELFVLIIVGGFVVVVPIATGAGAGVRGGGRLIPQPVY